MSSPGNPDSFVTRHSLSIATSFILAGWVVLYAMSKPTTHMGAFFGNAIADWSGALVMLFATKRMYEKGSAESKQPHWKFRSPAAEFAREHSLTFFLLVTGLGWVLLYHRMDPNSRWGDVVGNIVSEWTQILGMVWMTKRLIEVGSKESGAAAKAEVRSPQQP